MKSFREPDVGTPYIVVQRDDLPALEARDRVLLGEALDEADADRTTHREQLDQTALGGRELGQPLLDEVTHAIRVGERTDVAPAVADAHERAGLEGAEGDLAHEQRLTVRQTEDRLDGAALDRAVQGT